MRPSGIVSRSISLFAVEVDCESGRDKGLRKFLLGIRSRFEGKAARGKRGCCHKSLVELGTFPFASGQVAVVEVVIAGSIQPVPERNKLCATNHPRNRSDQPQTMIVTPNRLLLTLEPGTHT
jgi:hypothetical protein